MVLPEVNPQPYKSVLISTREEGLNPALDFSGEDSDGRDQMSIEDADRGRDYMMSELNDSIDDSGGQRDWAANPYLQPAKKSKSENLFN